MDAASAPERRPAHILIAGDTDSDADLVRLSFRRVRLPHVLHVVEDGLECLQFLRREGRYVQAPAADLLLLDIRLPRLSGVEVMRTIAMDQQLCHLPVVALTPFASETDIKLMYQLRCSACMVKPVDFNEFERNIQHLLDFWFGMAALPRY